MADYDPAVDYSKVCRHRVSRSPDDHCGIYIMGGISDPWYFTINHNCKECMNKKDDS